MTAPDHTIEPLKNFLHERGHPHMGILNRFNLTPSRSRERRITAHAISHFGRNNIEVSPRDSSNSR